MTISYGQRGGRRRRPSGRRRKPVSSIERVNLKAIAEPPVALAQDQWDAVNEFLSVAKSHGQLAEQDAAGALCYSCMGLREPEKAALHDSWGKNSGWICISPVSTG